MVDMEMYIFWFLTFFPIFWHLWDPWVFVRIVQRIISNQSGNKKSAIVSHDLNNPRHISIWLVIILWPYFNKCAMYI